MRDVLTGFGERCCPGRGWGANWFSTFRALGAVPSGATVWYCCSRQTPASSSDLAFPRPVRISGVPFLSLVCQLTFTLRSGAFKIPTSSHFCRSRRETADQMCLLRKKKATRAHLPMSLLPGRGTVLYLLAGRLFFQLRTGGHRAPVLRGPVTRARIAPPGHTA